MKSYAILKATILILVAGSTCAAIQGATIPPSPTPFPAWLISCESHSFTVAGPYHKFLSFLLSTEVIDILQNQAKDTEQGVTIFVPSDDAFTNLKKSSISNLTVNQLKSLLLFHAMPKFYTFADFRNLSQLSPLATFEEHTHLISQMTPARFISAPAGVSPRSARCSVAFPASVYAVDQVFLPEAIFGPAPSPAPAPVSAPGTNTSDVTPPSQSPPSPPGDAASGSPESSTDSTPSSAAPSSRTLFAEALFLSLLAINGACVLL